VPQGWRGVPDVVCILMAHGPISGRVDFETQDEGCSFVGVCLVSWQFVPFDLLALFLNGAIKST
jgi:hypothetical protein